MRDLSQTQLGFVKDQLDRAQSLEDVQTLLNEIWQMAEVDRARLPAGLCQTSTGLGLLAQQQGCAALDRLAGQFEAAEERFQAPALQAHRELARAWLSASPVAKD